MVLLTQEHQKAQTNSVLSVAESEDLLCATDSDINWAKKAHSFENASDNPHNIPACLLQTQANSWSIAKTEPRKS